MDIVITINREVGACLHANRIRWVHVATYDFILRLYRLDSSTGVVEHMFDAETH